MPEMTVTAFWWLVLAIALVVVLVVAILLIAIWRAVERIDRHAAAIWQAGKGIAANTTSIPLLAQTNQVATRILNRLDAIAEAARTLNERLERAQQR
ncbi:hypothetical protein HRbin28_02691 [bacterium HR28]|nr:hypothetical protein HRbin28_02691 [bacterium HR28]